MRRDLTEKYKVLSESIFSTNKRDCIGEKIYDIFHSSKNIL